MASGDVVLQATSFYVHGNTSLAQGSGTSLQTTDFVGGTTVVAANGGGVGNVHVETSHSSTGGAPNTCFDGSKRYTITITET